MTHYLTMFLINVAFYVVVAIWFVLGIWLLVGLVTKKWEVIKRASKYLINSVVFLVTYIFYMELAVVVQPSARVLELREWATQHLVADLWTAAAIAAILLVMNWFFYCKVESRTHKVDLLVLTVFDTLVLTGGAWLASQDAYLGLLEEANRNL